MSKFNRYLQRRAGRTIGSIILVSILTIFMGLGLHLNPRSAGPIYIILILLIATGFGAQEAIAVSLIATIGWIYYFIPPRDSFVITGFENWLSVITFAATGLITSHLAEAARRRTAEAVSRQQEMERLYALGRAILMTSPNRSFAGQIAEQILQIYKLRAAAVLDRTENEVCAAGKLEIPLVATKLEEAANRPTLFQDWEAGITVCSVALGGELIGSLALLGAALSSEGLQALANLVAVGITRVRAEETASRAEAARESQEFKSTLIDALAHEFKTPLTSLNAAASAILSNGVSEPQHQKELLTIIQQDAGRMNALVNEAIHIARIEAGDIKLRRKPCDVREIVERVLAQMEIPLEGRVVDLSVGDSVPAIPVDEALIQLALKQLIDNAIKYSPADTPLRIRATANGDSVLIRISDEGNGISEEERSKVFERFYRGYKSRNLVTGSGMGLAIAREIIRAHGGELRLESPNGNGRQHGTEFVAELSSRWNDRIQKEQA